MSVGWQKKKDNVVINVLRRERFERKEGVGKIRPLGLVVFRDNSILYQPVGCDC